VALGADDCQVQGFKIRNMRKGGLLCHMLQQSTVPLHYVD
jgi:hypothetical protein